MIKIKKGFTMAEMMVVMLVLTVLLAAAAPLMTKKKAMSTDTTWKYASNNSDIYYGIGDNQSAMIGQQSKDANDLNSRLIISTKDLKKPFITFKKIMILKQIYSLTTIKIISSVDHIIQATSTK